MAEKTSFNNDEWKCQKLKYVTTLSPNVRMTPNLEVTFLPMEAMHDGFYETDSTIKARDAVSYTSFEDGDILLAKVTPCFENGNLAIAHDLLNGKGFGSSEYHVLRCDESVAYNRFILYLLMNDDFKQSAVSAMTGSAGLKRVPSEFVMNYEFYLPPLSEQHVIAAYLDRKCGQIDDIIADLQRQIECLESYKKSLISEAVTKGLNPDVPMKDSGIEWIGQIPGHWEMLPFRVCVQSVTSGLSAVTNDDTEESGKYVLRTSAVSSGIFIDTEVKAVTSYAENRLVCPVEADTVIMSRMNTSAMVGASAYIEQNYEGYFLPDKLWKVKFNDRLLTKYAWYLMNSEPVRRWFGCVATGSSASMQNIEMSDFLHTYVPIPRLTEQKQLATYLDRKCAEVDTILDDKRRQVENMKNHRKSVIYEYVTGKKRVKEV